MSTCTFTREHHHVAVNRSFQLIELKLLEEAVGFGEFRYAMNEVSEEAARSPRIATDAYPDV